MRTDAERAQLYPNPASGVGTLRIMSGRLISSLTGTDFRGAREGIFNVKATGDGIEIEYGTQVPYAGTHEYGFSGSVSVPAHQRRITQAFGRQIEPKTIDVRSFTRSANIPARPYLMPAVTQEIDYLALWLRNNLADAIVEELQ